MTDDNWFASATSSPYLPIVAGLLRGVIGIASGFGFTWALTVSGDQITMAANAAVAMAMLAWSVWQKITAVRDARRAEVSAAVASANATIHAGWGRPVTVTVTPPGQDNVATLITPEEMVEAPTVPVDVMPSPAPRP